MWAVTKMQNTYAHKQEKVPRLEFIMGSSKKNRQSLKQDLITRSSNVKSKQRYSINASLKKNAIIPYNTDDSRSS